MNKKLQKWAESIVDYCNPIAMKYNLEYYPFQSPINEKTTDILIIGVNPRSNGNYLSQNENEKWEFTNGKMKTDRLLNGNPYFSESSSWRFFNNLKQIPFLKEIISKRNFTYMNYFYFGTKDASEMKKIEIFDDIVNFSIRKLEEIISILNPKLVIVLGVADGLDIITPNKTIGTNGNKRIFTKGIIGNIPIYGIPHSSRNYSYEIRKALDDVLSKLFEGKEISPFHIEQKIFGNKSTMKKVDIQKINNELKNILSFKEFQNKNHLFKAEFKGNNDNLDFRIDTSKGYFAFRALEKINNNFYELNGKEIYKNLFSENSEIEALSWLVYKSFQKYDSHQSIEDQIVNDLKKLLSNIQ